MRNGGGGASTQEAPLFFIFFVTGSQGLVARPWEIGDSSRFRHFDRWDLCDMTQQGSFIPCQTKVEKSKSSSGKKHPTELSRYGRIQFGYKFATALRFLHFCSTQYRTTLLSHKAQIPSVEMTDTDMRKVTTVPKGGDDSMIPLFSMLHGGYLQF